MFTNYIFERVYKRDESINKNNIDIMIDMKL